MILQFSKVFTFVRKGVNLINIRLLSQNSKVSRVIIERKKIYKKKIENSRVMRKEEKIQCSSIKGKW